MISLMSMSDWYGFDSAHPAPTFFARPAWASALAAAFPHLRPYPVWVQCNGTRVLIPLMQGSGGRLNWRGYVGMPLGTYTCALREDGSLASESEFEAAIGILRRFCDALALVPWPLGPRPNAPTWRQKLYETAVIDLSRGAQEALRGVAGVTRRMAGQAARRGVNCAPLRSGMGVSTYYSILREASERWGLARPPFPKELLEALVAFGGDDVEIWFAQCDAHPIAGGIVLYGSQELFFWSAAMRQSFAHLRPSNALNFALIHAGAERRVNWYNLGASEGLPGVERFKRGLGARSLTYAALQHETVPFNAYSRLRSSIKRLRTPQTQAHGVR
jgi:CelD/BcsL family acetyltransferase involved in cellulose biosynthesis